MLFKQKEWVEHDVVMKRLQDMDTIMFIDRTARHNLKQEQRKTVDMFGIIKKRSRTPSEIMDGRSFPI